MLENKHSKIVNSSNRNIRNGKGIFKNDVTGVGGERINKISDKSYIGGREDKYKKFMFRFLHFACFWSTRQQLSFG